MEALLQLSASRANPSCGSVPDLQAQLRHLFSTKVTETRSDHIAVTFELRATTIFHVPVTDTENEALEHASSIDPVLGEARSSVASNTPGVANQATRHISAIDTLINQPVGDHVLHNSVAKYIVSSLSEVDGSNWAVRSVSRCEQGWIFTYVCKDSWQAWSRQNSKNPARTTIGEWSNKDSHDSVNMSRPAFDCRGSVTIAFVKSTRTIDVKYDHTPIHKTVGQLVELLVPPTAPIAPIKAPPSKKAPKPPKPPKAPKPPKELKAPKTPKSGTKKKRPAEDGAPEGEGSMPKKRKKKKASVANADQDVNMIPPEMPGALPVGQSSDHPYYQHQQGDPATPQNGYDAYPEGIVGSSAAKSTDSRSGSHSAVSTNDGVHSNSILNLPPGEAARRREVAINLLNGSNIDPSTLSPDQFNIFANQSPELQSNSLKMLAKYGAARLRIVHPENGNNTGQTTPAPQNSTAIPTESTGAPQSEPPSASKTKKSRKKKSDAAKAATSENAQAGMVSDSGRRRKKTKGVCQTCRDKKIKCDKGNSDCSQCIASSDSCHYPLAQPRGSRVSKADIVQEDVEPEEQPEPEPEPEHTVQPIAIEDDESEDLGSPGFHHDVADLISPPANPQLSTFSQPSGVYEHHSGLTFPNTISHEVQPAQMDYIPTTVAETALHHLTYPPPSQPSPVQVEQSVATVQHENHTRSQSRRSLLSGPPTQTQTQTHATNHSIGGQADMWQGLTNQTTTAPVSTTRTSPRQARRKAAQDQIRNPVQSPVQNTVSHSVPQAYDDLRQTSSWSSVPQPVVPAPVSNAAQPVNTSPYMAAAQTTRAKSRQSHRAQNRTPVQNMSTVRPSQTQTSKALTDNSGYLSTTAVADSNSATGYDNYSQYSTTRTDSASNHSGAYDQYATNPSSMSNSYSYNTYNARPSNTISSTALANPVSTTSTAPSASQWGTTASSRRSYNSNNQPPAASTRSSCNLTASSTPQQSKALQGFNVRPQPPPAQSTRSSSASSYNNQSQQQQQRQSYGSYTNQNHNNSGSTATQQQNWYGFTAANNTNPSSSSYNTSASHQQGTSGGYSTGSTGGGGSTPSHSHAHGGGGGDGGASTGYDQPQHHRSMNLSSHTYSSIDGGDHALYEMLSRNNQQS